MPFSEHEIAVRDRLEEDLRKLANDAITELGGSTRAFRIVALVVLGWGVQIEHSCGCSLERIQRFIARSHAITERFHQSGHMDDV